MLYVLTSRQPLTVYKYNPRHYLEPLMPSAVGACTPLLLRCCLRLQHKGNVDGSTSTIDRYDCCERVSAVEHLSHCWAFSADRNHDLCGAFENPCHLAGIQSVSLSFGWFFLFVLLCALSLLWAFRFLTRSATVHADHQPGKCNKVTANNGPEQCVK